MVLVLSQGCEYGHWSWSNVVNYDFSPLTPLAALTLNLRQTSKYH